MIFLYSFSNRDNFLGSYFRRKKIVFSWEKTDLDRVVIKAWRINVINL